MLLNILINIVLPIYVLRQLSGSESLGPAGALIVAVAIPAAYFLWKLRNSKKANLFSIIGFVNVLFTGIIGLFELDHTLIFIKEAGVPFIYASAIIVTEVTGHAVARQVFGEFFQLDKVEKLYRDDDAGDKFDSQLRQTSILLALVFVALIPANYALARYFVRSPSGTEDFNNELGQMMTWNFWLLTIPVILAITWLVFRLIGYFKKQTGLSTKEFMRPWH